VFVGSEMEEKEMWVSYSKARIKRGRESRCGGQKLTVSLRFLGL